MEGVDEREAEGRITWKILILARVPSFSCRSREGVRGWTMRRGVRRIFGSSEKTVPEFRKWRGRRGGGAEYENEEGEYSIISLR